MAAEAAVIVPGVVPEGYKPLKEGAATVLLHGNDVFYNEAQVANRDMSIAVLRQFIPMLAQEHDEGKYNKTRQQRKQRGKVNAGSKGNQQADTKQQPSETQQEQEEQPTQTAHQAQQPVQQADEEMQPAETITEQPQQEENQPAVTADQQIDGQGSSTQGRHGPRTWRATALEGLAASGMRSIRYAKEVPGIRRIDANDMDPDACASIRQNVAFNGPEVQGLVRAIHSDARITMMKAPLEYDVVDLDPYGTPSQLLDSAVQCVSDGGILLVTATDMANLCGNNSVACFTNYHSYPHHKSYCHEQALRIILAAIECQANRYKRYIQPLLSVSIDFYVRVFVRVFTSAAVVKDSPSKLSYVWQSCGCDSFWLQPVCDKKTKGNSVKYGPGHGPAVPDMRCPDSGGNYALGGPIWSEPIHDHQFVEALIKSLDADKARYASYTKIRGLLKSISEELPDCPLYYNLHDVCRTVKLTPMKQEIFRSALLNAGYRVSGSHCNPQAIKTDAPATVIWDILRCWIKDHPVNIKETNTYAGAIVSKEPQLQADFTKASGAAKKTDNTPRFVLNPAYWGPKSRHGRPPVAKPGDGDNKDSTKGSKDVSAAGSSGTAKDAEATAAATVDAAEDPEAKRQRTE